MTITSEFTGTENYAERMAGLEAIHDWWFGAGSFAAAATLGQVRANLNTLLVGTTILNRETFATWLAKVNTLNEPTDYAAALTFGESQSGALWQCTLPASLRAATDGTGETTTGGTIARINDSSGNALHLSQASTSLRPVRGRRPKTGVRNLIRESRAASAWVAAGTTPPSVVNSITHLGESCVGITFDQTMTPSFGNSRAEHGKFGSIVSGLTYTPSFHLSLSRALTGSESINIYVTGAAGFGIVTLTQANSAGLVGTWVRLNGPSGVAPSSGAVNVRPFLNGALGSPVTLYVSRVQLEEGTTVTPWQDVGTSLHDITEDGVESVSYAAFDLVDDVLTTGAIAGGLTGQAFVAGDGGCYVSDLAVAAGGAFSVGGTSHNWTGAAPGILRAVTGDTGRVLDAMIRGGAFTEDEIARLERFYRAQGGKGLLVPGPEVVANGGFDADTAWSKDANWSISGGVATCLAQNALGRLLTQAGVLTVGTVYRLSLRVTSGDSRTSTTAVRLNSSTGPDLVILGPGTTYPLDVEYVFVASQTGLAFAPSSAPGGEQPFSIDNVSVRRLIPREDL